MLWVYILTRCDHAGLMKYNKKLIEFQTGIKGIETVMEQLGNRIVRLTEVLLFCPKFLTYQYPGFPNSKVASQRSAVDLLLKNGVLNEGEDFEEKVNSYLTVTQHLPKSCDNGNGYDNGYGNGKSRAKIFKPDFASIPESHRPHFEDWYKYKTERGDKYKETGWAALVTQMMREYPNGVLFGAAVLNSVANQWKGIHSGMEKTETNVNEWFTGMDTDTGEWFEQHRTTGERRAVQS